MGDDLRTLEELITPDVIRIFVRIDHALRHRGSHLAEHVDHLPRMGQVRLGVDHDAPARLVRPELASHTRFFSFSTAKQLSLTCFISMGFVS
jgi:hypothetical protein